MSFEEETYTVGTKDNVPTTSGHIPKILARSYGKVYFYFCYYYPTTYGKIKIALDQNLNSLKFCVNTDCSMLLHNYYCLLL